MARLTQALDAGASRRSDAEESPEEKPCRRHADERLQHRTRREVTT
jgi:hypothetical protein